MQTIDDVEYLEVDEAAALLGVKKATIYAYVSRGVLGSFRQGLGGSGCTGARRSRRYARHARATSRRPIKMTTWFAM